MLYNDLCLLSGQVVTGRRRLLEAAVPSAREGRLALAHRAPCTPAAHVVTKLNVAINRREEGLVEKDLEAVYKPGGQAGAGLFANKGVVF